MIIIKKAIFIGVHYQPRKLFAEILNKHPMFELIPHDSEIYYYGKDYYDKINQYAMAISLNGNGEFSHRDFETMGLGIPILRSELITPMYVPLIPNIHYIKGSPPSLDANRWYPNHDLNDIAYSYIDAIEKTMYEPDFLNQISNNSYNYFKNNLLPEKMVEHFFTILDINLLKD